ncbi:MAG: tRNA pseudouridine(38-40) synthase TruA [Methylocystaceae bacterium]
MISRIKCIIEYDGTPYVGFQIQPNGLSVQEVLENTLTNIFGQSVRVSSASRTDAGVHAHGQVIIFDVTTGIPAERICRVANDNLPADIRILKSEQVPANFHPRYDARGKTYRYIIYRKLEGSAFWHPRAWIYRLPLDLDRMQAAAAKLVGTYDMSCFCASGSTVKNRVRTIQECSWLEEGAICTLTVTGSGFLYHQVRNMVGTMTEIGRGVWEPEYIDWLLTSGDRNQAGPTAPAAGLYLEQVIY